MAKSFSQLLREARSSIREVTPAEVEQIRVISPETRIVDVRETTEWDEGHIPGAAHVARGYLEQQIEAAVPDRNTPVVLYCAGGVRSALAVRTLEEMGYTERRLHVGRLPAVEDAGSAAGPRRSEAHRRSRSSATAVTC